MKDVSYPLNIAQGYLDNLRNYSDLSRWITLLDYDQSRYSISALTRATAQQGRNPMTGWNKPFNQPAKLAERVLAPGDGEAEPGEPNHHTSRAHEVGDR